MRRPIGGQPRIDPNTTTQMRVTAASTRALPTTKRVTKTSSQTNRWRRNSSASWTKTKATTGKPTMMPPVSMYSCSRVSGTGRHDIQTPV